MVLLPCRYVTWHYAIILKALKNDNNFVMEIMENKVKQIDSEREHEKDIKFSIIAFLFVCFVVRMFM